MIPFAQAHAPPMTTAARIERALALAILRGEYAVGSKLPPVRALAAAHAVTVPTIQRVLAGLEALGLVVARQGSGVTVADPVRAGTMALLPLRFEAESDPERSVAVLADFLALRRLLTVELFVRRHAALVAAAPDLAARLTAVGQASSLPERVDADLAFSWAVVLASGDLAVRSVWVSVEQLVRRVPWVAEALYEPAERHLTMVGALTTALVVGGDARSHVGEVLERYDAGTVEAFRARLTSPSSPGHP